MSQFIILLLGMVFAWANFAMELNDWLNSQECSFSCPLAVAPNPFATPCFFGAVLFSVSFVLSALLLKKTNQ